MAINTTDQVSIRPAVFGLVLRSPLTSSERSRQGTLPGADRRRNPREQVSAV
jgi:hypothetical protein